MVNLNNIVEFSMITMFTLLGAISNDYVNTMLKKELEIDIGRILVSSITGSLVVLAISEKLELIGQKPFMLICFTFGIGGFTLFQWIQELELSNILKNFLSGVFQDRNKKE